MRSFAATHQSHTFLSIHTNKPLSNALLTVFQPENQTKNPTVRVGSSTRTSTRAPRKTQTTPGHRHPPYAKVYITFPASLYFQAVRRAPGSPGIRARGEGEGRGVLAEALPSAEPCGGTESRGAGCAQPAPGHTRPPPAAGCRHGAGDAAATGTAGPTCNDSRRSLPAFGFQPHLQSEGISGQLHVCLQPQLITLATEIERPARGKGLLFVLYLPLLPPAGDMPRLQPSSGAPSSG